MANSLNKITTKSILDATVATADIADNAITLAKMAGGTDGQIITYDANGDPVAVGPGSDGQVLTSTGAGSPPAFENVPASVTLSGSTDNTVVTVTGANAMQGEGNLLFDGNDLIIKGTSTNTSLDYAASQLLQINNSSDSNNVHSALSFTFGSQDRGPAIYAAYRNTSGEGDLIIAPDYAETAAVFKPHGAVELYYDNAKKFETTSGGAKVTGELQMGGTAGVKFSHSGTTSIYESQTAGDSLVFKTTPSGGSSTTRLTISSDGVFRIPDGDRIYLGTDHDLMLYHTGGAHSYLRNDTGQFYIQAENNIYFQHTTDGGSAESMATFNADGSVELYYDNSKKFETTSGGVQVTGNMVADAVYLGDDEKLYLGTGDDFQMWHEASSNKTIFKENGSGSFDIRGNTIQLQDAGGNENLAVFTPDGGVNLYHNNVLKFNTWAEGCKGMGIVHAMGRVDGQGTAHVDKEWGLDSFTDNSSGNYTVGFTHDLSTDNECIGIINVHPVNTGSQIFGFGVVEVNNQSSADLSMRRVDNDAPSLSQDDWDNIHFVIFDID